MNEINLLVVAHPDDEVLGFGATGAKLVKNGQVVQPVILCGQVDVRHKRPNDEELYTDMINANSLLGFSKPVLGSFPNLRMNTVAHVEMVQFIEQQIRTFSPTRIFTHHPADLNDDHRQISKACMVACRYFQRRSDIKAPEMLAFMEIQSATDWSFESEGDRFNANLFIEIEQEIDIKIQALQCYRNVMRDYPHPRSVEAIKGLAAYRGAQIGQMYSEAFQVVFQRGLTGV